MKNFILENGKSVIIREARGSDAIKLLEQVNAISSETDFLTFGQGEFIMSVEEEEKHLENTLRQNNAIFIIAEIDEKIVGCLNFTAGSRPRVAHTGEFGVSVLKEYWGNGIGAELIKQLIKWCKQLGSIRKINLIVRDDNFSAIHVYKKLGFTQEGIITRNLQINGRFYDALFMAYKID